MVYHRWGLLLLLGLRSFLLLAVLILVIVIVVNVVAFPLLLGLGPSSMSNAKAAFKGKLALRLVRSWFVEGTI